LSDKKHLKVSFLDVVDTVSLNELTKNQCTFSFHKFYAALSQDMIHFSPWNFLAIFCLFPSRSFVAISGFW
jgi:hypothetical protein